MALGYEWDAFKEHLHFGVSVTALWKIPQTPWGPLLLYPRWTIAFWLHSEVGGCCGQLEQHPISTVLWAASRWIPGRDSLPRRGAAQKQSSITWKGRRLSRRGWTRMMKVQGQTELKMGKRNMREGCGLCCVVLLSLKSVEDILLAWAEHWKRNKKGGDGAMVWPLPPDHDTEEQEHRTAGFWVRTSNPTSGLQLRQLGLPGTCCAPLHSSMDPWKWHTAALAIWGFQWT